ncbi:hypothetical protein [Mesorhizobium sp. B2-4-17]|uniref:hypothetical protein n=1 Tax=Mesorhizobium sp. B2-4-17 TaxID=2589932 RepID=UPI0011294CFE|nr:hypothetical protein [Mesorhizobium sp. B2-4-17]TPK87358.1 hypothetical protein FJ548_14260 [Mesorhizobium sp. B2-4-17]
MAKDWELRITRAGEQPRKNRRRTIGRYEVFHDGVKVVGLSGAMAETKGPGDNKTAGNNRCVEAGTYGLFTQDGEKYVTIGYTANVNPAALKRPGLLLLPTGKRVGILIHPGRGFLSSIGCINPASKLGGADNDIDFIDSRKRVIAIIDDLKAFLGSAFPASNGKKIPNASVVIQ